MFKQLSFQMPPERLAVGGEHREPRPAWPGRLQARQSTTAAASAAPAEPRAKLRKANPCRAARCTDVAPLNSKFL